MRHSSNKGSSLESSRTIKKTPRKSVDNTRNSPNRMGKSSPRRALKLHKRTLDTSDSPGEMFTQLEKTRKDASNLCNGDIDLTVKNQGRDVHSMSIQVGSSLLMDNQEAELSCDKKQVTKNNVLLVSASAQVGDSLQMMDIGAVSPKNSSIRNLNTIVTDSAAIPSNTKYERELIQIAKRKNSVCEKDSSSNNLTPIVDTQAQRVVSSDSNDSNRQSGEGLPAGCQETNRGNVNCHQNKITSQESHTNGLQLDTIYNL